MEVNKQFVFIPAIAEQILNVYYRNKEKLQGQDLVWWTKNSPFEVDAGLLSAYYLYMRTEENYQTFRQRIDFPLDKLFMLDSGGFEIQTQQDNQTPSHKFVQKNLTAEKVLQIQEATADIGIVLDRPPYVKSIQKNGKTAWFHDEEFFKGSMEFTAKNTEIALSKRSPNSKLKIYGVLQGEEKTDMIRWFNTMKNYKVDGWALVPTPKSDYLKTFQYIELVLTNKIDVPIHFLGISGLNAVALIIYLLRKDKNDIPYFPHLITSDSSSYNTGARIRNYTLPGGYKNNIIIGRDEDVLIENKEVVFHRPNLITGDLEERHEAIFIEGRRNSNTIPLNGLPCLCPVCTKTSVAEMRSPTNVGSIAVSLHNLYIMKGMVQALTSLIAHPETYINYVLGYNTGSDYQQMKLLFEKIDNMINSSRGHEVAATEQDVNEVTDIFGDEESPIQMTVPDYLQKKKKGNTDTS
jgi:queuine/archaeosine tRNA-ribosyltransferase